MRLGFLFLVALLLSGAANAWSLKPSTKFICEILPCDAIFSTFRTFANFCDFSATSSEVATTPLNVTANITASPSISDPPSRTWSVPNILPLEATPVPSEAAPMSLEAAPMPPKAAPNTLEENNAPENWHSFVTVPHNKTKYINGTALFFRPDSFNVLERHSQVTGRKVGFASFFCPYGCCDSYDTWEMTLALGWRTLFVYDCPFPSPHDLDFSNHFELPVISGLFPTGAELRGALSALAAVRIPSLDDLNAALPYLGAYAFATFSISTIFSIANRLFEDFVVGLGLRVNGIAWRLRFIVVWIVHPLLTCLLTVCRILARYLNQFAKFCGWDQKRYLCDKRLRGRARAVHRETLRQEKSTTSRNQGSLVPAHRFSQSQFKLSFAGLLLVASFALAILYDYRFSLPALLQDYRFGLSALPRAIIDGDSETALAICKDYFHGLFTLLLSLTLVTLSLPKSLVSRVGFVITSIPLVPSYLMDSMLFGLAWPFEYAMFGVSCVAFQSKPVLNRAAFCLTLVPKSIIYTLLMIKAALWFNTFFLLHSITLAWYWLKWDFTLPPFGDIVILMSDPVYSPAITTADDDDSDDQLRASVVAPAPTNVPKLSRREKRRRARIIAKGITTPASNPPPVAHTTSHSDDTTAESTAQGDATGVEQDRTGIEGNATGAEEAPTDEQPGVDEQPGIDEQPGVDGQPGVDEDPGIDEQPGVDEDPAADDEEPPVMDEQAGTVNENLGEPDLAQEDPNVAGQEATATDAELNAAQEDIIAGDDTTEAPANEVIAPANDQVTPKSESKGKSKSKSKGKGKGKTKHTKKPNDKVNNQLELPTTESPHSDADIDDTSDRKQVSGNSTDCGYFAGLLEPTADEDDSDGENDSDAESKPADCKESASTTPPVDTEADTSVDPITLEDDDKSWTPVSRKSKGKKKQQHDDASPMSYAQLRTKFAGKSREHYFPTTDDSRSPQGNRPTITNQSVTTSSNSNTGVSDSVTPTSANHSDSADDTPLPSSTQADAGASSHEDECGSDVDAVSSQPSSVNGTLAVNSDSHQVIDGNKDGSHSTGTVAKIEGHDQHDGQDSSSARIDVELSVDDNNGTASVGGEPSPVTGADLGGSSTNELDSRQVADTEGDGTTATDTGMQVGGHEGSLGSDLPSDHAVGEQLANEIGGDTSLTDQSLPFAGGNITGFSATSVTSDISAPVDSDEQASDFVDSKPTPASEAAVTTPESDETLDGTKGSTPAAKSDDSINDALKSSPKDEASTLSSTGETSHQHADSDSKAPGSTASISTPVSEPATPTPVTVETPASNEGVTSVPQSEDSINDASEPKCQVGEAASASGNEALSSPADSNVDVQELTDSTSTSTTKPTASTAAPLDLVSNTQSTKLAIETDDSPDKASGLKSEVEESPSGTDNETLPGRTDSNVHTSDPTHSKSISTPEPAVSNATDVDTITSAASATSAVVSDGLVNESSDPKSQVDESASATGHETLSGQGDSNAHAPDSTNGISSSTPDPAGSTPSDIDTSASTEPAGNVANDIDDFSATMNILAVGEEDFTPLHDTVNLGRADAAPVIHDDGNNHQDAITPATDPPVLPTLEHEHIPRLAHSVNCEVDGCDSRPFEKLGEYKVHLVRIHGYPNSIYVCDYCSIAIHHPSDTTDGILEHLEDGHLGIGACIVETLQARRQHEMENNEAHGSCTTIFKCIHGCEHSWVDLGEYANHLVNDHGHIDTTKVCKDCSVPFPNNKTMKHHRMLVHAEIWAREEAARPPVAPRVDRTQDRIVAPPLRHGGHNYQNRNVAPNTPTPNGGHINQNRGYPRGTPRPRGRKNPNGNAPPGAPTGPRGLRESRWAH